MTSIPEKGISASRKNTLYSNHICLKRDWHTKATASFYYIFYCGESISIFKSTGPFMPEISPLSVCCQIENS